MRALLKSVLILVLFCCSDYILAQSEEGSAPAKIKLLNADQLLYDAKDIMARKLIGNVKVKHQGAIMTCDSAYMFTQENRINAYSNVEINQGDTVFLYGDSLKYSGDTRLAELRGNIKLIDPNQILTTAYLDYDMDQKMAYYLGGGIIETKDSTSTLSSEIGYYYTKTKLFYFKNNVEVVNPDYTIYSDTLEYASERKKSYFHGPTTIISDSNTVFCEKGWYDQLKNLAEFTCNAAIISKDQQLRGDSIFYNQNTGEGEVFRDVDILDTTNSVQIFGDYARYNETDSTSLVTGSRVELIQFFDLDSLFLHADSLYSSYDSTRQHREMFAYHKVKFYKSDLQGKCDSMAFLNADSSVFMFEDPIIWSKANQMTGDTVQLRTYDGEIEYMKLYEDAFIVSKEDTNKFNQIKGRRLKAFFNDSNDVYRIDVNGNGQTIYYGKEADSTYMGLNRLDCSEMKIMLKNNQIDDITFYVSPVGLFEPMSDVSPQNEKLDNFNWFDYLQPKSRSDIFIWKKPKEQKPISAGTNLDTEEVITFEK